MRPVGCSVWLIPTVELRRNHNAKFSRHGRRVFARMGHQSEPLGMSANSSRQLSALQDSRRLPTEVHTLPGSLGGRASVRPVVFSSILLSPFLLALRRFYALRHFIHFYSFIQFTRCVVFTLNFLPIYCAAQIVAFFTLSFSFLFAT